MEITNVMDAYAAYKQQINNNSLVFIEEELHNLVTAIAEFAINHFQNLSTSNIKEKKETEAKNVLPLSEFITLKEYEKLYPMCFCTTISSLLSFHNNHKTCMWGSVKIGNRWHVHPIAFTEELSKNLRYRKRFDLMKKEKGNKN